MTEVKENEKEYIDISFLIQTLWKLKWIPISSFLLVSVLTVFYTLSLPNVYRSDVLLIPSEETQGGGLSALAGKFGSLASFAGINLGNTGNNKVIEAIELVRSRKFAKNIIAERNWLIPMFAVKNWDPLTGEVILDSDVYNEKLGTWVRDVSPPRKSKPGDWEAYEQYLEKIHIVQDKKTGLVTISAIHISPIVAQKWVEGIVTQVNKTLREQDIYEAEKSIDYLNKELDDTSISDMRVVFYQLIEEQTKKVMLANTRFEYVFRTIDPAVVPEEKFAPRRSILCIAGGIAGGLLGVLIALGYELISSYRKPLFKEKYEC